MATEYTYIEKEGVGYKTPVSEAIKLLLKDYMEEIIAYPAGDTVIEEIIVDGVVIAMANGRQITKGTYPLYEEFNQINNAVYNLPDYTTKKNVISNFPNSGKIAGDKIDWLPPTHSHAEKSISIGFSMGGRDSTKAIYQKIVQNPIKDGAGDFPIYNSIFDRPIKTLASGDSLTNTGQDKIIKEYQPAVLSLTPYIVVDYRG